jgi:hypothetical protein
MRHGHMGIAMALGAAALMAATPVVASDDPPRPDPEPQPDPDTPVVASDAIPDRVSLEDDSPYYFPKWRQLGVRHNGGECNSVVEFCVSEGWIRTQIFHGGRPKAERGKFVTVTRRGTIEPYWRSRP